jgi:peptidoglycan-N-acetylglucosamine deacetylase
MAVWLGQGSKITAKARLFEGLAGSLPLAAAILRNGPPLLDTRILALLMLIPRLLLLLLIGFIATNRSHAQTTTPIGPITEKSSKPAASAEPRITFSFVHVDGPYIAMTFDDGPNITLTPKLLDLLAAHHIKATFFVIGQNVADHPQVVQRAVREGHEIGNHSWSHPYLAKMSDEAARRELRRTDDAIKNATGTRPTLMRPPYGSITTRQKRWINDEFGYQIILWDVDPLDWKRPGPTTVCNRIVKETRPGSIVLSHDIHPGTIEAMPATFNQLEAKGFKFVTVSELIQMAKPETPKPTSADRARSPGALASSPAPSLTTEQPGGAQRAAPSERLEGATQSAAVPTSSPGD